MADPVLLAIKSEIAKLEGPLLTEILMTVRMSSGAQPAKALTALRALTSAAVITMFGVRGVDVQSSMENRVKAMRVAGKVLNCMRENVALELGLDGPAEETPVDT